MFYINLQWSYVNEDLHEEMSKSQNVLSVQSKLKKLFTT